MASELEDLRILKATEDIADAVWKIVVQWDEFAQDVVGKQLARAIDSIGANIAESYGRFNYGEKLQFLYYSRGSLFETKYWLNRALVRELMQSEEVIGYAARLSDVARQLNMFANSLKSQRRGDKPQSKSIREPDMEYQVNVWIEDAMPLFTDEELNWLES
ncbi:MAG TPA: four helix bundle protein [Anaerolineales bacterium]|jgi:four helix bundle protein|nr:four helix bundle protein [Anaerolineales bacterium]